MFKSIFQRIFDAQKCFQVFFIKAEKVLGKFQHVGNNFKNFKHAVGKTNEVKGIWKRRSDVNMR